MPEHTNYVVITPVRDEAVYFPKTIASMASQTILPSRWVIVDDGSTDGTSAILNTEASRYDWVTVVHRPNRGRRASGGGVIQAFYDGFPLVADKNWEFIVKLDGDLSFKPDYFESCFKKFGEDPRLGLGGGVVCYETDGYLKEESVGDPPFHVRGATKIYRRPCWEQISPLVKSPGWDTIDEVKANMAGWRTRTFRDLPIVQHKPTGTADGSWRNWFKNGRANYITGYHPLFMLAKCFKRSIKRPMLVEATALGLGFCGGYLIGEGQVPDRKAVKYLRREQLRRLFLRPSIYSSR